MRSGFLSAAAVLACLAVSVPADSFAAQQVGSPSTGMLRSSAQPRAPLNPPRFQAVKAGPLKGPARLPAGFRDRSIPQAALPQKPHRHPIRHAHRHLHGLPLYGIAAGYYPGPYIVYADNQYTDEATQVSQSAVRQCRTERVKVESDKYVNVTRC